MSLAINSQYSHIENFMKLYKVTVATFILSCLSFSALAETIWLDVRSSVEYKMGHIKGAVHLPHTEIANQAQLLLPNKDSEILIYCRSGGRAEKAKNSLKALGYHNLKNVGGLSDAEKIQRNKEASPD